MPKHPDPYSSGAWFWPWRHLDIRRPLRRSPVIEPRSYDYIPGVGLDSMPGPSWPQFEEHVD